jgi:two-component system cell cycle response regulator
MPARILLIEDNPTNLQLMVYLLRAFGHETTTAAAGEEGIEAVHRDSPDLVICDIQMPGIDGYEVARRLKRDPSCARIPLVAVTALAMVGDSERALSAGFDGYISKPIDPENFVSQVEAFLPSTGSRAPTAAQEREAPSSSSTKLPTRILLVDNSPVNHALVRTMLEPVGYMILSADSVAAGLERARRELPDLILSDLHMPDADGLDLLEAVKADPLLRTIPFVFLSSTFWPDRDLTEGLLRGAKDFIGRPVEPQALLFRIEACLAKSEKP